MTVPKHAKTHVKSYLTLKGYAANADQAYVFPDIFKCRQSFTAEFNQSGGGAQYLVLGRFKKVAQFDFSLKRRYHACAYLMHGKTVVAYDFVSFTVQ